MFFKSITGQNNGHIIYQAESHVLKSVSTFLALRTDFCIKKVVDFQNLLETANVIIISSVTNYSEATNEIN